MTDSIDHIPGRLRYHRREEGRTLDAAAALLRVSPATLSRYEAGLRPVPLAIVARAAEIYGQPIGILMRPAPSVREWQSVKSVAARLGFHPVSLRRKLREGTLSGWLARKRGGVWELREV